VVIADLGEREDRKRTHGFPWCKKRERKKKKEKTYFGEKMSLKPRGTPQKKGGGKKHLNSWEKERKKGQVL